MTVQQFNRVVALVRAGWSVDRACLWVAIPKRSVTSTDVERILDAAVPAD